jgi:hypothetical protein
MATALSTSGVRFMRARRVDSRRNFVLPQHHLDFRANKDCALQPILGAAAIFQAAIDRYPGIVRRKVG